MHTPCFKSALCARSLNLCHFGFLSSLPSPLQTYAVANEQGVLEENETTGLIERATAQSTTRFLASEADMLGERQL